MSAARDIVRGTADLTPEFRLLAACSVRPPPHRTQHWMMVVTERAAVVHDWDEFTRVVRRQQLPGLAYEALQLIRSDCPDRNRAILRDCARAAHLKGMKQIAASRRISAEFCDRGIEAIQLKGPPLAARLYGNPLLRESVDIDVLVPFAKLHAANTALADCGYSTTETLPTSLGLRDRVRRIADHHCSYQHRELKVHVELHWRSLGLSISRASAALDQRVPDATTGFASLPRQLELVDLILHGSSHYWQRLKWLADIQQTLLLASDEFVSDVRALAGRLGATHAVEMTFLLLRMIYGDLADSRLSAPVGRGLRKFTAAYALRRLLAQGIVVSGVRAALDRSAYRILAATPSGLAGAALRCVV